jgi:hypothetical protein
MFYFGVRAVELARRFTACSIVSVRDAGILGAGPRGYQNRQPLECATLAKVRGDLLSALDGGCRAYGEPIELGSRNR